MTATPDKPVPVGTEIEAALNAAASAAVDAARTDRRLGPGQACVQDDAAICDNEGELVEAPFAIKYDGTLDMGRVAQASVLAFLRAVHADYRWPSDEQAAAGDMADRLGGRA